MSLTRRAARLGLLLTVFICAACGLVYELALVTLGSFLIGDTAVQASIVLSVMIFAMGVGALIAKPLQRWAAPAFAAIELALAAVGGFSVIVLYSAFAWLKIYTGALVVVAFVIGLLVGAEIPLLMVLLQRIRQQAAGSAVADLFAADYIGALLGGLAFPFLLLPAFGQVRGALVVGAVNAVAGLVLVFTLFRRELGALARGFLTVAAVLVSVALGGSYLYADRFEATAEQALFANPIVYSEQSRYQKIVVTQSASPLRELDTRLFLNGDLQFSSVDEYRYHEALVHPALAQRRGHVLVLGGGDGLALREILTYPDVERVTLVELDPAVVRLARTFPALTDLNRAAFDDPRVTVVNADAFGWLRDCGCRFDAIVVDFPDPDQTSIAKLYSREFYGLLTRALEPGGAAVIQSGSPFYAPNSFWCIEATVRAAGLQTQPYHLNIPSFGDWGFVLATRDAPPRLHLPRESRTRSLDDATLAAATVFPPDRRSTGDAVSSLLHPVILDYNRQEWSTR
ncbi:polyamine aminopropyltransferase [Nocardia sp. NPDC051832]|uniref:polyamine aminopropyltransferase n=1 Tax=Nocardia sp. NPDC051832 TaxID=3155673 RepID=UPI00341AC083